MPEQQLRLFPPPKPLLDRLGEEFFDAIPKCPGVYLMLDNRNKVVYVGQSKNLRQRLASYKNAHPERVARKIVKLVHSVENILWEECKTEFDARLRENQLLRIFRPRFNTLNTYPEAYCFIGCEVSETRIQLLATREKIGNIKLYGAFRTRSFRSFQALLRLLWVALFRVQLPYELPRSLLLDRPPKEFAFEVEGNVTVHELSHIGKYVVSFLEGSSPSLLEFLKQRICLQESSKCFEQEFFRMEFEILEHFYRIGPERTSRLRRRSGLSESLVNQEELDDLLLLPDLPGERAEEAILKPENSDLNPQA